MLCQNNHILDDWALDIPSIEISKPEAAAIAFAKINLNMSSEEFVFDLRDNYSVLLTAGSWHGLEGYVRFGYGNPTKYIEEALSRVKTYLAKKGI